MTNKAQSHNQMQTLWLQEVLNDPQAKEDLEKTLRNATVAFTRLLDILEGQKRQLETSELKEDYAKAAWAYKQAHKNGYRQHLQETIDLLTFIKG